MVCRATVRLNAELLHCGRSVPGARALLHLAGASTLLLSRCPTMVCRAHAGAGGHMRAHLSDVRMPYRFRWARDQSTCPRARWHELRGACAAAGSGQRRLQTLAGLPRCLVAHVGLVRRRSWSPRREPGPEAEARHALVGDRALRLLLVLKMLAASADGHGGNGDVPKPSRYD